MSTTAHRDTDIISIDPLHLAGRDPHLAERAMNRWSLEEQVRYVLALDPAQRLAACELSTQCPALIATLPEQEWWLTLHATGKVEALALLQHATPEQLQFCLDIDGWTGDQWSERGTIEWLPLLVAAGEAVVRRLLTQTDPELVGLMLKRWISVYRREKDEDVTTAIQWPRSEPPMTLDGTYYFQIAAPALDPVLRPLLETLARNDLEEYLSLLDRVLAQQDAELEELAYEQRERRLAEYGFPEWNEAVAVYRRLTPEAFAELPRRRPAAHDAPVASRRALALPEDESLFLHTVMTRLDDRALSDAVLLEAARIANRVVVADRHTITPSQLAASLQKTIGFVNIGLERASGGDVATAIQLLTQHWVTSLFQFGYSEVMRLREAARDWLRAHPTIERPDDPTTTTAIALERLTAASWEWPKYYLGPQTPDGHLHRDFRTIAEIAAVQIPPFAKGG